MVIYIDVAGNGEHIPFCPGDVIDLGADGLIRWFTGSAGDVMRAVIREQQKAVREAIAVTKAKHDVPDTTQ